jgi:hypothetical protein
MPQLSFDKASELHKLVVTVMVNEVADTTLVTLFGMNRQGVLLASTGVVLSGFAEVELLPRLMSEAAYGYLYGGSREAVTVPAQNLRAARKALKALSLD